MHLHDPHNVLGLHEQGTAIRLWRPGSDTVHLEVLGQVVEASKIDLHGLFEYKLKEKINPKDYLIYHKNGSLFHDPYAFCPTIGELDTHLFSRGCHYELYRILGAHLMSVDGIQGCRFAVWAPNAKAVSLVGDFNHWDGRLWPMRSLGFSGIWELFVPGLEVGEKYKYEIHTPAGVRLKSDPFAFYSELRPNTASIVADLNAYSWKHPSFKPANGAMSVYEVHLGSWKNQGSAFSNYRDIAIDLAKYCKEMGFTHVELLPIMEHPLDESWGYQLTGFFSVTSRYGGVEDFQFFVDHMHSQGIGVILDWVPAHFPTDDHSLNRFDGTALYEHDDPRKGIHPHWNTAIFNYGRKEVSNFLIASALFWLDVMHVDGLRVDAVASMIYLDYGRKEGEWIPNPDGSHFNVEAIEFIKHLNSIAHEKFPHCLLIAEESSSYTGVTHKEGLQFDLKWNMGWMNDTLKFFSKDPIFRKFHQNELTFSLLYAFTEKFMSVLSHDEVVHSKNSLLSKMPGDEWQKFANLRLLYSYMICQPGKKLLFMGGEIGQWSEWDCKGELDWYLLQYPMHQGLSKMVKDLNHFYQKQPPLWECDFDWQGYEWIDFSDADNSVISYFRKSKDKQLLVIHNFTPQTHEKYEIHLNCKKIKEIFNTDRSEYGGSGKVNDQILTSEKISIRLPPLSTLIFDVDLI